ncbi:MAG: indolepyruvate ferredoxin oxidoreductase, partial [Proteobacteria bacterium]|nr:indolepyruvate ferredoxin oxidoreductase [Pseudomonadota bacterium]
MAAVMPASAQSRLLLSGNEAVARAVWESGVKVAAGYPGTPATEMLETLSNYPKEDMYTEWSVNEKVSLEVSSRAWGRFAHVPILEPADSQEAYAMVRYGYELSEEYQVPVILRMTARICHVKGIVCVGERVAHQNLGFTKNAERWVMVPGHAKRRLPLMYQREQQLKLLSDRSPLNLLEPGSDRRVGFITSGPAYMHVRETFPDAPVLKLGMSYPWPLEKARELAGMVDTVVVVEETEPILEMELKAAGIDAHGKDALPRIGELAPEILKPAVDRLLAKEAAPPPAAVAAMAIFPRPPTLCASCPHMGVYYTLSQLRNLTISGDIGCYTLGAGHP